MQNISKPRIVDFLRTCDKNNWVFPRIRFASVRSKPELIEDIENNFFVSVLGNFISITPRQKYRRVPEIHYCLSERKFLLDGEYRELRKESREKPKFQIQRGAVTIVFGDCWASNDPLSKGKASEFLSPFRARGTGVPLVDAS